MKIADAAVKVLTDESWKSVGYFDCNILDSIGLMAKMKRQHPLNRHQSILRALENDLRFEKFYFRARRGLARYFKLREKNESKRSLENT